ncbi:MAG: class I SAM-dependent methyltransferase [Leptolinea sp.]
MKRRFDHFDFLAPIYEIVIRPNRTDEFWSLVDMPENGIILDAGGGTGRVAQFLAGKVNQIIVCDLSIKMLQETLAKEGLQPVCAPSEIMPFSANLFNRIIMVDALHHVVNQLETAAELWRVLKPGGHIVIEEPDINKFGVKLIALAEKIALMRSHFLNSLQIANLFRFSDATVEVCSNNSNSWILIKKGI